MVFDFIGRQRVDYVSKKTGRPVKGWNLYFVFKDTYVEGKKCFSTYVNDSFIFRVPVGTTVIVYFDFQGRIESMVAL